MRLFCIWHQCCGCRLRYFEKVVEELFSKVHQARLRHVWLPGSAGVANLAGVKVVLLRGPCGSFLRLLRSRACVSFHDLESGRIWIGFVILSLYAVTASWQFCGQGDCVKDDALPTMSMLKIHE